MFSKKGSIATGSGTSSPAPENANSSKDNNSSSGSSNSNSNNKEDEGSKEEGAGSKKDPDNDEHEGNAMEMKDMKQTPPKKGDYVVQVHIIEARKLKGRDASGLSDPICFVSLFLPGEEKGEKQHTEKRKQTSNCIWNHLMEFSFKVDFPDDLYERKMSVQVFDANTISRNVLIGEYELDLDYVYHQKDKELYRQWVGLMDSSGKNEGVQGYLKLSVTLLGPGDEQIIHEESAEEEDDNMSNVLLPSNLPKEKHLLRLKLFSGNDMVIMDTFVKSCDPYGVLTLDGKTAAKSKVKKSTLNPVWDEELRLPVILPTLSDHLLLELWDYDAASKDELIGNIRFSYAKVREEQQKYSVPRWYNIYGAPRESENLVLTAKTKRKMAARMNDGRMPGSAWRGRILAALSDAVEKDAHLMVPSKKGQFMIGESYQPPKTTQWLLRVDVYQIAELPISKDNIVVKVSMGSFSDTTSAEKCRDGQVKFNANINDIIFEYPEDVEQLPDIFVDVHVKGDKERLGYLRISPTSILLPQASSNKDASITYCSNFIQKPRWELLTRDVTGPVKRKDFPGFIQFSLGFGRPNDAPKARAQLTEIPMVPYLILTHIYQGRELPAADNDGASDPYCIVRCAGASGKTVTRFRTLAPLWYQTVALQVQIPEIQGVPRPDCLALAPKLNVLVYDFDQFSEDDFLGRVTIDLSKQPEAMDPLPSWHPLYLNSIPNPSEEQAQQGMLLVSVQLVRCGATGVPLVPIIQNPKLEPDFQEAFVEIVVMGLRNLAPYQMLPAQSPYIVFSTGDVQGTSIQTKRSSTPSGSNPTYGQIIRVPIHLPNNAMFTSTLSVIVFDHRFGGLRKAMLGTASFSLEKLMSRPASSFASATAAPKAITDASGAAAAGVGSSGSDALNRRENSLPPIPTRNKDAVALPPSAPAPVRGREMSASTSALGGRDMETLPLIEKASEMGTSASSAPSNKTAGEVRIDVPTTSSSSAPKDATKVAPKGDSQKPPAKGEENNKDKSDDDDDLGSIEPDVPDYMKNRTIIDNELEDTFSEIPFDEFQVQRGHIGKVNEFGTAFKSKVQDVGKFKGLIRIVDKKGKVLFGDPNRLQKASQLNPGKFVIRVYVLRGLNVASRDDNGKSDPYLKFKLGKHTISDRHNYLRRTLNPEFFRVFELETSLPGASQLEISMYDFDALSSDDLIGKTTVDLENRWFSNEWQALAGKDKKIPVERRTLWCPTSSAPCGKLEMWLEILPKAVAEITPITDISKPPPEPYELRLVVWRCKNLTIHDRVTHMNDARVVARLEGAIYTPRGEDKVYSKTLETDTHWRARKGKAEFNYRLIFHFDLPMVRVPAPRLYLQAWDVDLVDSNDAIGEAIIPMKRLMYEAFTRHQRKFTGGKAIAREPLKENTKKWVKIFDPNTNKYAGEIEISMEVMHHSVAETRPAAKARDEPNNYPVLPDPTTRIHWSWNPCFMLYELLGPELCIKIVCGLCCLTAVAIIIMIIPMASSSIFARILVPGS